MKKIPLTQGKYAIVDDEDFPVLSRFNWHFNERGLRSFPYACYKSKTTFNIPIVRFLVRMLGFSEAIAIDGDYLNCQKSNIKLVTSSIKRQKQCKTLRKTSSRFKGVCKANRQTRCWRAHIVVAKKQYSLGYYKTEEEAAIAYNRKALEIFGENAYQNKINS